MALFIKSKRRCRECKDNVIQNGYLFRCTKCKSVFWHRSVLSKDLNNDEVFLEQVLKDANVPIDKNTKKNHFYVYRITLTGKPSNSVYVGMTGLHPYYRYLNHLRGHKAANVVKRRAKSLIKYEGPMSYIKASEREKSLKIELGTIYNKVYGGH